MNIVSAFCHQCFKEVSYNVVSDDAIFSIKGIEIPYKGKRALCCECGSDVWVAEIDDYNVRAPRIEYCRQHGLITADEVKDLTKKYNIGARPLAKLLCWGEVTIVRYIDGDIPTKEYSDRLKELFGDCDAFYQLLVEGKDKITDVAYRKAMTAVEALRKAPCLEIGVTELYEKLGMTRNQFAKNLGVTPSTVKGWETGTLSPCSIIIEGLNKLNRDSSALKNNAETDKPAADESHNVSAETTKQNARISIAV
ncbi:MAG: helix-turn-helix domain-containing protein [Clostridia bacterium]|nr:helix-turn-helix domain-containing protein [Clostridia bacterium]